ncbi:MAG: peptidase M50 [Deltaproteobacteria bacterium]|nr:peptidase M50 [Deltaproteobacteria bacterium]
MKPRLRSHVQIHRHTYRGKDWFVLQDHSTGGFHRFSSEAYLIIGLLDGNMSMDDIWKVACERLGDDAPTQDEVIGLLSQLHQAGVLQAEIPPDLADLYQRQTRARRSRWMNRVRSPMALRFPIMDPDRFLKMTAFLVRPFLGWFGALLWLAVVSWAVVLLWVHWSDLTGNLADRVLATENLLLLWWVYPLVKAVHEFGHAYAVKRWGGEVHEMGIMLLVLIPIPYVDASASSAFREKHKRLMVDLAGILVEVFLAAAALLVWVNVEPGTVRTICYNVMIIAGISTILFNGNPLLRFDAYYALSDLLDIPNLGTRANRYLGYLIKRHLLGIRRAQSPVTARGEAGWMVIYALASFIYRIFISVRIALFVAGKFFVIGVLLALWAAVSMVLVPVFRVVRSMFQDPDLKRKRGRILVTTLCLLVSIGWFLVKVPIPSYTVSEGVLWTPEESRIHAAADGFVAEVLARPGQVLCAGAPIIRCFNPDLDSRVRVLAARIKELQSRRRNLERVDRTEADIIKDEIQRVRSELKRARDQQADLVIRSPSAGTLLLPDAKDLPGRFLRRGTPLGYVVDFPRVVARVMIPQSGVDLVRNHTRAVQAQLAERIGYTVPARVIREVPEASRELPSIALSVEGGGRIALDPTQPGKAIAFEKLFQFEVALSGIIPRRIGERVFVRFEHDPEPLVRKWSRAVRRLLLSRFDF